VRPSLPPDGQPGQSHLVTGIIFAAKVEEPGLTANGRPSADSGEHPHRSETLADHRALILVVERDPNIRELEAFFLKEEGFAVEFAADGIAALERAREILPDIVITEILVPGLDGLSLCRKLKQDPQTQNIAVLVFSILMVETRAKEAGADACLRKPLADRKLVDTVRELLALHAPGPKEARG
jgi:CheY-like chemotaxis protein